MFYLIGTDEAGYGPNLGPLAVSASLWRVEDDSLKPEELFKVLAPTVSEKLGRGTPLKEISKSAGKSESETQIQEQNTGRKGKAAEKKRDGSRKRKSLTLDQLQIPIADSKKLHRHETLVPLEIGIFAMLNALGEVTAPVSSRELFNLFCGETYASEREDLPWHTSETEELLPRDLVWEYVPEFGKVLSKTMRERDVTLCGIRSELVFPQRFNDETEKCGSKGVFLSDTTLKLVVHFWEYVQKLEEERRKKQKEAAGEGSDQTKAGGGVREVPEVRIYCDKHGGRNFYLPALMEFFPNLPFCIVQEGREFSEYVHYGEQVNLRIRFQAKGETLLPVALASMVSKYLREVSMDRFNLWWQKILPGIQPTAGYPLDAKRFREEISEKMEELQLDWRVFWRNR